jgi:hypothetical protein
MDRTSKILLTAIALGVFADALRLAGEQRLIDVTPGPVADISYIILLGLLGH